MLFFVFVTLGLYPLALLMFFGTFLDTLDGAVARKQNKATAFGGFLDSTLDRVSDFFMIAAFAFGGIVSWELMSVLLFTSFLISYIRSRGELASEGKTSFRVGLVERPFRLGGLFLALLLYTLFPAVQFAGTNVSGIIFLILIILSLLTIIQRILHAWKKL